MRKGRCGEKFGEKERERERERERVREVGGGGGWAGGSTLLYFDWHPPEDRLIYTPNRRTSKVDFRERGGENIGERY